ncbi:unnamed protein product [Closterium sp. NIES-53]
MSSSRRNLASNQHAPTADDPRAPPQSLASQGPSQQAVWHASRAAAESFPHVATRTWVPQYTAINGGASGARSGIQMASSTSDSIAAAASALNHNSWRPVDAVDQRAVDQRAVDQRAVDWAGCDVPALSHLLLLEQMRQMRQMGQAEQRSKAAADAARRGEARGGSSEHADYSGGGVGGSAGGGSNAERTWETSGSGEEPAAGGSNNLTAADAALLSQLRSAHDSLPRPSFQSPTAPHDRTPASGGDACWEASGTPGRGFREPQRLRAPGGGSCGLQMAVAEQLDQLQREERRDEFEQRETRRDSDLGARRGATGEQREFGRYNHMFERAVGTDDTCPPHARPSPLLSLAPDFRDFRAGRGGGVTGDGSSADALAEDLGLASQQLVDGVAISNSGDASGSRGQQSPSINQSRSGNDWGFGGREGRSRSGGAMAPPTRPASAAITSANARAVGAAAVGAAAVGAAAVGAAAGGASAVAGAFPGGDDVARAGDSAHLDPQGAGPAGPVPRGSRSKSVGQMQAARILQALEHGARERVKRRRTQQKHLEHLQLQQEQHEEGHGQVQQQCGLPGFALLTSPLSVSSTPSLAPSAAPSHTPAHAAPHAAHIPPVPIGWGHGPPAPVAEAWGGAQGRSEGEAERRRREQERMAFDWSEKGPRSHSEAEKRRRERINQQLSVLRALLPGAAMARADKASVLAEAVAQLRALRAGLGGSCGRSGEGECEGEGGKQGTGNQEGAEGEAGEGQGAEGEGEEEGAERADGAEGAAGAAAGLVASSLLARGRAPEATPREDDAVEVDLVWAHVAEEERADEVGDEVGGEQDEEQEEVDRRGGEGLAGRKRKRGSEGERVVCVCVWCEDGDGLLPAIQAALKPAALLAFPPISSHFTLSHPFTLTSFSPPPFPLLRPQPFPLRLASLESASCGSRVAHVLLLHACPALAADTDPAASFPSAPVAPDFKPALAARPPSAASAAAIGAPGSSAAAAPEQEQQLEGMGRPGAEVNECEEEASHTKTASGEGGVAQYVREVRAVVVDVVARWRRGEMVSDGV